MKVLVVEDSGTVRQQVRTALMTGEFDVVEATDGVEGLDRLETAAPSVVICDVSMPRMNGIEMIEKIQASGRVVPIIMLTADGHPDFVRRARAAGAKGWIVKPFDPAMLAAAVRRLGEASAP